MGTFKSLIAISAVAAASILYEAPAKAQTRVERNIERNTEEVIIRKKKPSSEKLTIILEGDSIIVNGKRLKDHKDENVIVLRRQLSGIPEFPESMAGRFKFFDVPSLAYSANKAVLGVVTEDKSGGAYVVSVTPGSGAEKAGIKEGDIIVGIDSKKIQGRDDLVKAIGDLKPETEVTVHFQRNGKKDSAKAKVSATKNTALRFFNEAPGGPAFRDRGLSIDGFGMKIPDLGELSLAPRFRLGASVQDTEDGKGVKILEIEKNSVAEKSGLKEDDLILSFEGKDVNDAVVLSHLVREAANKKSVTMKISRKGKTMDFEVAIPRKLKTANL